MKELIDINKMTFEEALYQLEKIVKQIDNSETTLDETVKNFEQGMLLKKFCQEKLNKAQLKVEKIIQSEELELKFEEIKTNG